MVYWKEVENRRDVSRLARSGGGTEIPEEALINVGGKGTYPRMG